MINAQQIHDAQDCDLPAMIENLKKNGWAVDDNTTLDQAKNMSQFQAFVDGTL
jgi:hypothetical protein